MPPAPRPIRWKRLLRAGGLVIGLSALIILVYSIGWSWNYSFQFLHSGCQGDRASLAERGVASDPVSFPSRHGPMLRGWLAHGSTHPEIAIVVIPGHAGNTRFALDDAEIAARAGFSTLIYENRSCADPSLAASTGYWESYDLLGAVDYLKARTDVSHVGVWGFSEGGTASLLAAPQDPAIEAVVAMGGYSSLKADILDANQNLRPLDWLDRRFIVVAMGIQLGVPVEASAPIDHIAAISPRPLFLVYGEYEAENGRALYAAAREPKELWIVPGSGHGGYLAAAPDEYRGRIPAFFNQAFGLAK